MIELRELVPDDWPLWRELRLAALADAPAAFGTQLASWQGEGDREERWRARLAIPGSYNIVAVLDEKPVGMASGVPSPEAGVVELISMWVAPTARGRGVGDFLIACVQRWAIGQGARLMRLAVAENNHHAIALYRRNGFQPTGELGDLMPDGVTRECFMAKDLAKDLASQA